MIHFRMERDSLGEVKIPAEALWGPATARAIENFPISGRFFPRPFISALGLLKATAARANSELKLIEPEIAKAIWQSAEEVREGVHDRQFPVDIFQTGSGTSTNMNANEVIANLANIKLGGKVGTYHPVHPNDHVNKCQSSNDVMPSVTNLAALYEINKRLLPALALLHKALAAKAEEFSSIYKIGRTHLMDAMPIKLGSEFGGWARQIEQGIERVRVSCRSLLDLALGGTAVGTGFGAHPNFAARTCSIMAAELGLDVRCTLNHFSAQSFRTESVEVSGALKTVAVSLVRMADDIKLMSSGPRLGLGELRLPSLQPGSSMMPGKVNPVIPEMVSQVGIQVIANDTAVAIAASGGHLELNTYIPLIAANLLDSIEILANASRIFAEKCVSGIGAREERCRSGLERSLSLSTALVEKIGYDRAAQIAKDAATSGKTIREVALDQDIASEEVLNKLLDVKKMV